MNFIILCAFLFLGMANCLPQDYDQGRSVPGTEFSGLASGQRYQGDQVPASGFSGNQGFGPGNQGFRPGNQGFGPGNQGFGPGNQGHGPGNQGFENGQGFNHRKGYQEMGY